MNTITQDEASFDIETIELIKRNAKIFRKILDKQIEKRPKTLAIADIESYYLDKFIEELGSYD